MHTRWIWLVDRVAHIHSPRSPRSLRPEALLPHIHSASSPDSLRELPISTAAAPLNRLILNKIPGDQHLNLSSVLLQDLKDAIELLLIYCEFIGSQYHREMASRSRL